MSYVTEKSNYCKNGKNKYIAEILSEDIKRHLYRYEMKDLFKED